MFKGYKADLNLPFSPIISKTERLAEKRSRCSSYVRCTNFLNLSPSKFKMALLQKFSSTDLSDGNSFRSLLEQLIIQVDTQQNEIIGLRDENDRLLNDNYELEKRNTKLERYSSYMCLNFHGISVGGEYPVQSIVRILRAVQIFIEPEDIAACHYLPRKKGKNRPIVAKFLYNHQIDAVWNKQFDLWDEWIGGKIYDNERLAEKDRDIFNYCRRETNLLTSTHKNHVQIKIPNSDTKWKPVENRKKVDVFMAKDISLHSGSHNVPTCGERDFCEPDYSQINKNYFSSVGTPGKRKRNVAFNSPSSQYNHSNGIHEEKIDKLCCLVEKLIERNSTPPKSILILVTI